MKFTFYRNAAFFFLLATFLLTQSTGALLENGSLEETKTLPAQFTPLGFSELYKEVPVSLPDAYLGLDYELPVDLANVRYMDLAYLSEGQLEMLKRNGFVVRPSYFEQFHSVYEEGVYPPGYPMFITTDSLYHTYHLVFDKILRDLERKYFIQSIDSLTSALVASASEVYQKCADGPLDGPSKKVLAYFSVAQQLISKSEIPAPGPVSELVDEEIALIMASDTLTESPIFGFREDYSQYKPRGHYTRDESLERYFRAMMWYGRIGFSLGNDDLKVALLVTYCVNNTEVDGHPASELWSKVYDPTVFFVGKSDDLSFYDYTPLMDDIFEPGSELIEIADDAYLEKFRDAAKDLPAPEISSVTQQSPENGKASDREFRFMGQRFIVDSYIFEQVAVERRWLPVGLDVFAAMGNDKASELIDEIGMSEYEGYPEKLADLQDRIAALDKPTWTQNLYWNWMHCLNAVVMPKGAQYPGYMRTDAWARKDIQTGLSSWTELKHDTILYAKQVFAEGDFGDEPEEPEMMLSYVEPNPEAFARLLSVTRLTRDGLTRQGLLSEDVRDILIYLDEKLAFLLEISRKELSGKEITEEEYTKLQSFGGWLEYLVIASSDDLKGEEPDYFNSDDQVALIADVATGDGSILEEAVGYVDKICVVVPDGRGGLQLAQGAVFSYYEFAKTMDDRLNDEQWHDMLRDGNAPERPSWTKAFIAE